MKRTLLAVAVLGATAAVQAEQTTPQGVYPYVVPFVYTPVAYAPVAPLQVDAEQVKAYVAYQQKAYEHYLAYQRQAQENTPAFLRIPARPEVPSFNSQAIQDAAAESERLRAEAKADSARRADALQQDMTLPVADIDQAFVERKEELDAALAGIQQRLDARQKTLDASAR